MWKTICKGITFEKVFYTYLIFAWFAALIAFASLRFYH